VAARRSAVHYSLKRAATEGRPYNCAVEILVEGPSPGFKCVNLESVTFATKFLGRIWTPKLTEPGTGMTYIASLTATRNRVMTQKVGPEINL
jgi:hypothetical protein